jgi:hypothetical protein
MAPDPISPAMWEDVLGGLVVGRSDGSSFADELAGDPGVDLIHTLVCEFRAGMVVEVLLLTSRLLLVELGDTGFRALLGEFWRTSPPQVFKAREGEAFAAWLADRLAARELDIRCLPEVLAFERAVIHALVHGEGRVVPFPYDPLPVLRALAAGRRPTEVAAGRYEVEVTAENGAQLSVAGVLFGSASG